MLHNEPLVRLSDGEHNLLSVSPEVNTKAYHDAFMKMPLPKPVADAAYLQAGRILQKADGKDEEYLVAIDARVGTLVADNLKRGGCSHHTTFIDDEVKAIRVHAKEVLLIHNHPHSAIPSFRDVLTASENQMVQGSIVLGHDGSVWYISAPTNSVANELMSLYNQLKDDLGDWVELRVLSKLIKRSRKVGLVWLRLR